MAILEPDNLLTRGELGVSVNQKDVSFETQGNAYAAVIDDVRIAQWESRAAALADAAAVAELEARYSGWDALAFAERMEVAGSLRLWLEHCPNCGGRVEMNQETVESCCYERQVLAMACDACESRLFEADVSPDVVEAA